MGYDVGLRRCLGANETLSQRYRLDARSIAPRKTTVEPWQPPVPPPVVS